jgi:hypothetical protein
VLCCAVPPLICSAIRKSVWRTCSLFLRRIQHLVPSSQPCQCMPTPRLQVESRAECLPADLWACQHLTRLDLDLKGAAALAVPAAHGAPCLPALQELRLARCRLPGGALPEAVCQLSGLRRLEVVKCGMASCCTSASAGLPPQFSRLCNLVSGRRARCLLQGCVPCAALHCMPACPVRMQQHPPVFTQPDLTRHLHRHHCLPACLPACCRSI